MYRLGEFTVDPHRFELLKDGARQAIQPRALRLLLRLIEARGGMVTKEEIVASVWNARFVSESALSSQVKLLRKVLGDTMRPHRIIETVHGQGLRIAAEIRREGGQHAAAQGMPQGRALTPREDGRPSIAVLPLRALSGSERYPALPQAIPDEVITALSKLRWLRVCARGSSFRYRSFDRSSREIGEALGVDYGLAGAVEIDSDTIRLSFELSCTADDVVVWRETLATPLGGIHEVRQEIVTQVAGRIEKEVSKRELDGLRGQDPEDFAPWQAFHLGLGEIFTTATPDYAAARRLFEQAAAQDPRFARAHAGLAQVHYWSLYQRQADDPAATAMAMREAAERAIALDSQDPFGQLVAGRSRLILHQLEEGLEHLELARAIAPSYALAYSGIGGIQALRGQSERALANFETALKLSPQDPWKPNMLLVVAGAHMARGDLAAASEAIRKVLAYPQRSLQAVGGALSIFAQAGETEEAERMKREFTARFPGKTVDDYIASFPIMSDELKRRARDGFGKMGLAGP